MSRRRRRNDPRLAGFFDTPTKAADNPRGQRSKRKSTRRDSDVTQVAALLSKNKRKKDSAAAGASKKRAKKSSSSSSSSSSAPVRPPPYPHVPHHGVKADGTLPAEIATQRIFEQLVDNEVVALEQTYSSGASKSQRKKQLAGWDYLVDSINAVCAGFTKQLRTAVMQAASDDTDGGVSGATAAEARAELEHSRASLSAMLTRAQTEAREWEAAKKSATSELQARLEAAQTRGSTVDANQMPKFLNERDREFLSKSCAGKLRALVPQLLVSLSVQGDAVLSSLRELDQAVADAQAFESSIASRFGRKALGAFTEDGGADDPKELIGSLLRSAGASSSSSSSTAEQAAAAAAAADAS